VVAVAIRVWRRREAGLTAAVRTGVHKPTLAVMLAAQLAYVIFRRVGLGKLNRPTSKVRGAARPERLTCRTDWTGVASCTRSPASGP